MSDDFFAGIETAEGVRRLPDLLPGVGVVEILEIKRINAQTGSDVFVIGEAVVIEHPENKPGDMVKIFMTNLRGKYPKSSLADVRMFNEAIVGGPLTQAEHAAVVTHNTLKGRRLRVQATRETKGAKTFTKYIYSHVGGAQAPATKPTTQAAPPPPPPVTAPARTAIAPEFPPAGWYTDPHGRGYYDSTGAIKSEAELRAQAGA